MTVEEIMQKVALADYILDAVQASGLGRKKTAPRPTEAAVAVPPVVRRRKRKKRKVVTPLGRQVRQAAPLQPTLKPAPTTKPVPAAPQSGSVAGLD